MDERGEPVSAGRWFLSAVWAGVVAVVGVWLVAAALALLVHAALAVVVSVVMALALAFFALRLEHAAIAGSMMLLTVGSGLVASFEAPRAWMVAFVTIVEVPSLDAWPAGAKIVRAPQLETLPLHRGTRRWTTTSHDKTSGSKTVHHVRVAVPIHNAAGRVEAFQCDDREWRGGGAQRGQLAVVYSPWTAHDPDECAEAIDASLRALQAHQITTSPGARQRLVWLFADEAALRAAPDTTLLFGVPGALLVFHLMVAVGVALGRWRRPPEVSGATAA